VDEFTRAFLVAHSQISRPNPLGVCEISPLHRIRAPAHVVACREGPNSVQCLATPRVTKMGRPKKNFEEKMVTDLTFVRCNNNEIALIVGCNDQMLRIRLMKPLAKRRAEWRKWLREQQNAAAKKGDPTIRIRQADQDRADHIPQHQAVCAIQVPSTDSPHTDLEESPYGLADRARLDACYRRYGRDSLSVRSHIRAELPDLSSDQLIPESWLDYAPSVQRPNLPPTHPVYRTRRIATDLGEGVGRDSTEILVRDDYCVLDLIAGNALSLANAAEEVSRLARVYAVDASRVSYDKLGIGRDFRNHLVRRGLGDAVGYAGSGKPQDRKAFSNLRSEAAWKLRRRLNPDWALDPTAPLVTRQHPFYIPPRDWWALLREDLEALTYDLVGNQTRLIKKEDLLARLGRSPDGGDAMIHSMAFD